MPHKKRGFYIVNFLVFAFFSCYIMLYHFIYPSIIHIFINIFFFSFSGQIFHRSWWRALSLHFRLFAKQKTCLTGKLSGNKAFVHGSRILRTSKVIYKIHNKWLFFKSDTTSHIYYRSETASPLLGTLKEWNLPNNKSIPPSLCKNLEKIRICATLGGVL